MEHTPGQWKAEENREVWPKGYIITDKQHNVIAVVHDGEKNKTLAKAGKANARLIAKAPLQEETLEALQSSIREAMLHTNDQKLYVTLSPWLNMINAALNS